MRIKYVCDICGREFGSSFACKFCESSHFYGEERIKYELIHIKEECICDHCSNCYYVYGCERNCKFKDCNLNNNFKYFKLKENK